MLVEFLKLRLCESRVPTVEVNVLRRVHVEMRITRRIIPRPPLLFLLIPRFIMSFVLLLHLGAAFLFIRVVHVLDHCLALILSLLCLQV